MRTEQPTPLAATLEQRGISQRDFAKTIGVEQSQMNRWCRGHFKPLSFYRQQIAGALDLPEEELWP